MLKRFFLALTIAAGFAAPCLGYGTIPFSLTQQFDKTGKPLIGGQLFLIQAGTTATPQNCFQDSALTIAHPNPITLDAAGRIPQLFCADGSIKIRLTDASGVSQVVADNILVVGPSGGGGGGGSVDPTTILATGDLKVNYGTGVLTGFVRANGRTIGNATSGATERANADTSALFAYLWTTDANLTVSGGRGASAVADYAANKTIALPDWRGRALAGLDDMGNSAAGKLTNAATGCGTSATVLGAGCGQESVTLTTAMIPAHNHPVFLNDPGHFHAGVPIAAGAGGSGGGINSVSGSTNTASATTGITVRDTAGGAGTANQTAVNAGGGGAHPTVTPLRLATIYMKL